ncbi:hypothetical protein I3W98_10375 [Streptomyces cavourensis]|nr:hypothetical protein [Streptomyces cavourensis]
MAVTAITSLDHFREVSEGSTPALIGFWAAWNEPWRRMDPSFESVSNEEGSAKVAFCTVNLDDHQDIAQEAGTQVIPTLLLHKDGTRTDGVNGAHPDHLKRLVEEGSSL